MPNEPPTLVAMKRIFSGGTFIISAALAREPMTPCVGRPEREASLLRVEFGDGRAGLHGVDDDARVDDVQLASRGRRP